MLKSIHSQIKAIFPTLVPSTTGTTSAGSFLPLAGLPFGIGEEKYRNIKSIDEVGVRYRSVVA